MNFYAYQNSGPYGGLPGTHPGQTPFNGTETWSQGDGGWPRQESFFNQRYFWVNGEFTPPVKP